MIANIRFTSLKSISLPLSSLHTPQPNKCNIHYLFDLSIKIPPPNSNASWTFSKMSWCFKENSLTNLKVRQGAFIEDKKIKVWKVSSQVSPMRNTFNYNACAWTFSLQSSFTSLHRCVKAGEGKNQAKDSPKHAQNEYVIHPWHLWRHFFKPILAHVTKDWSFVNLHRWFKINKRKIWVFKKKWKGL